jgi:hypothetical protein
MKEEDIRKLLDSIPGARRGADGVIVEGDGNFFYATGLLPSDSDLTPDEQFFVAICAKKEIIRLRQIKTPHDYLLRFCANALVDSARLVRVISARRKKYEGANRVWSLTGYYDSINHLPKRYIARLSRREQKLVRSIPFGFAALSEATAVCLGSLVGKIVIVSEALRYFFYFMTICLHGPSYGFSAVDCTDAGLIALRIMKGAEAQDFDIDPRESIPRRIRQSIEQRVGLMLEFTFGHEFSHLTLGHMARPNSDAMPGADEGYKVFLRTQEYDADEYAIRAVVNDTKARLDLSLAAYNVFLCLYMLELVAAERADFQSFYVSTTHPSASDRLWKLRESMKSAKQPGDNVLTQAIAATKQMKDLILSRIEASGQKDLMSLYGSIHIVGLGGKPGIDRIDF